MNDLIVLNLDQKDTLVDILNKLDSYLSTHNLYRINDAEVYIGNGCTRYQLSNAEGDSAGWLIFQGGPKGDGYYATTGVGDNSMLVGEFTFSGLGE